MAASKTNAYLPIETRAYRRRPRELSLVFKSLLWIRDSGDGYAAICKDAPRERRVEARLPEAYRMMKGDCVTTLQTELPLSCQRLGLPVADVRVERVDEGSLDMLVKVVLDVAQVAGAFVDLHECAKLISSLIERILCACLADGGWKGGASCDLLCTLGGSDSCGSSHEGSCRCPCDAVARCLAVAALVLGLVAVVFSVVAMVG